MEEDAFSLVANASATAASEIRDELADCLRRLDLINLTMPGIYLSYAIDRLDEDIHRIAAAIEVPELG
jgi:hypothetical protein